jgi:hypothetical protein
MTPQSANEGEFLFCFPFFSDTLLVAPIGLWLLSRVAVRQQQPMFLLNTYQLCTFILLVAANIHLVALVDSCLAVGYIMDELVEFFPL